MMSTYDFIDYINEKVERHIAENFETVFCSRGETGLDTRCGYIFINEECVAVRKQNDGTLQYYGGFEYIDKEFRHELGDYVFYLRECDRVDGVIEAYYNKDSSEETNNEA